MKPKKFIMLEAKIAGKGDTNEILADYLGICQRTLWKKRTGQSYWTTAEMKLLHKRYDLTDDEISDIVMS